jgi:hypothetical protein
MLNSDVYWLTYEMDVTCDLLCWITTILARMLVGLKFLVISLDYRSYMGSSVRIWSLRWLFLYLYSYNLDGSVTGGIVHASCQSVSGQWVSYPLPPLCGVVMLERRGIGMTSDRTEVTDVTSFLVRSLWRAYSRPLPVLSRGHDGGEVACLPCG